MNQKARDTTLFIDLNKLEEECQNQPPLLREWGDKLVKAKRASGAAANRLKLLFAEISAAIRANPEDYDIVGKPSLDVVKEAVLMTEKYQQAQEVVLDAEEDEGMIQSMVYAIVDRREELGNLTKLHGQMYWAKTERPAESKEPNRRTMRDADERVKEPRRRSKPAAEDDIPY